MNGGASVLGNELAPAMRMPRPPYRLYRAPLLCGSFGAIFATMAAVAFVMIHPDHSAAVYRPLAAATALMFVMCAVSTWWYFLLGGALQLYEHGVVLTVRKRRQYTVRYTDIETLTIRDTRRYGDQRETVALNRTITVNGARARYIALLDDPLNEALDLLVQRVSEEPRPRSGDGWTFDDGGLHWRGEVVPIEAMAGLGIFDDELRVWRQSEEQPFFSIALNSPNARVLLNAMERRLPAGRSAGFQPAGSSLGRLMFTRHTSRLMVILRTIVILAILYAVTFGRINDLGRGALLALATLAILHAVYRLTTRYGFHEGGVTRTTLLGTRALPYENLGAMTWRENLTAVHDGVNTGLSVSAKLVPKDGSPPLRLQLRRYRADDEDLGPVRHALAAHVAVQWNARLERGESVPWTKQATFTPAGLQLKKTLLPYGHHLHLYIHDGYLHLYEDDWRNPLALLPTSAPNFYPGLALFELLAARAAA